MINQTEQAQIYVQLLVGAGLVNRDEFADFKKLAKDLNIPLIQAIMNSGTIKKENLNLVAEALTRVQSKQISPDLAIRALRVALKKGIKLPEAINEAKNLHKTTSTFVSATNDLTNFLLDANVLKRDKIGPLLLKSHESSIMIGQVMIIEGVVSVQGLLNALNGLLFIRGGLDRNDAIKALQHSYQSRVTIEQALFELGKFVRPDVTDVKIGELFLMAKLITLEDYTECLEIEIFKQKNFTETLLERGLVVKESVLYAEQLMESIKSRLLEPHEAAQVLSNLVTRQTSLRVEIQDAIANRISSDNHKLGDLVVEAGLCKREEVESSIVNNAKSAVKVGSALIKANLIDEKYLYFALRLQTSLRQGYIDRGKAIGLLVFCYREKKNLDEAFVENLIYVPSRMQWSWV